MIDTKLVSKNEKKKESKHIWKIKASFSKGKRKRWRTHDLCVAEHKIQSYTYFHPQNSNKNRGYKKLIENKSKQKPYFSKNKAKMVKLTHNNSNWKVNGRKRLKLDVC